MLDVVMHAEVAYRQLVIVDRDEERLRVPLLTPLNDALVDTRAEGRVSYLHLRYGHLGWTRGWSTNYSPADFLAAAEKAPRGHFGSEVAEHLEKLRFNPDGTLRSVPDLAALAAWSLLEAVRREQLKLRTCPTCKQKWLAAADEPSRFCQRRVNGTGRDCRTLERERRLAGSDYAAYRREYNRLTEKQRRGTLSIEDLYAWRHSNSAPDWVPFEQWKENRNA